MVEIITDFKLQRGKIVEYVVKTRRGKRRRTIRVVRVDKEDITHWQSLRVRKDASINTLYNRSTLSMFCWFIAAMSTSVAYPEMARGYFLIPQVGLPICLMALYYWLSNRLSARNELLFQPVLKKYGLGKFKSRWVGTAKYPGHPTARLLLPKEE